MSSRRTRDNLRSFAGVVELFVYWRGFFLGEGLVKFTILSMQRVIGFIP
jgi:hypothetical protein